MTYCAGPKCLASHHAAAKLLALGYKDVQAYRGGLEEWKAAGLPTEP